MTATAGRYAGTEAAGSRTVVGPRLVFVDGELEPPWHILAWDGEVPDLGSRVWCSGVKLAIVQLAVDGTVESVRWWTSVVVHKGSRSLIEWEPQTTHTWSRSG